MMMKKDKATKNDPFRFQGEGITFKGKLIGSEAVAHARGDRICADAMSRLKAVVKASGEHKQRVSLTVSLEGIKVFDEKSHDLMCHHPVHRISFISQDQTDPRAFGYVSGTPQGGHTFIAIKTEKAASQVVIALRDLFQTVLEMKQQELKRKSGSTSNSTVGTGNRISLPSSSTSHDFPDDAERCKVQPEVPTVDDLLDLQSEMDCLRQGIDQIEGEITSAEATFGSDPFGSTSEVSQASSVIESNGYFQPNKVCLPPVNSTPQPLLPPPPTSSLPSTPKKTTGGQTRQNHGSSGSSALFSDFPSGAVAPTQTSMTLPKGFTPSTATSGSSWLEGNKELQRVSPSPAQGITSDMASACLVAAKPPSKGGQPLTAPHTSSQTTQFSFDGFDFPKANLPPPPPGSRGSQQGRSNTTSTSSALLTLGELTNTLPVSKQIAAPNTQSLPRPHPNIVDELNVNRVVLPPSSAPSGGFNAVFENARPNSGLIGNVAPHSSSSVDSVFNDDFRFTQPAPVQREANFSAAQFSFESVASSLSRARTQESTELFELSTANRAAIVAAATATTNANPIEAMGSSSSFSSSTVHSGSETASPRFVGGLSSSPPCNREVTEIPPADKYAVFQELKHQEEEEQQLQQQQQQQQHHHYSSNKVSSFAPPEVNSIQTAAAAAIQPPATTQSSAFLFADFAAFTQNPKPQTKTENQPFSSFNDSGIATSSNSSTVQDDNNGMANFANFDKSFNFGTTTTTSTDAFETDFAANVANTLQTSSNLFGDPVSAFESNFDAFSETTTTKPNEPAAKRPPMLNAAMRSNPFCALSTDSTPSEDFNTPQLGPAPSRKGASSNDNSVCSPSDATTATNQFVSAASSPSSDRFVTMASGSSLSSSENDLSAPCPSAAPCPPLPEPSTLLGQPPPPPFPPFAFDSPQTIPAVSFASPLVAPSPAHEAAPTAVNPFCMGSFTQLPSQKSNVDIDEGFCGSNASSVSPHLPQKMSSMNTIESKPVDFVAAFPPPTSNQFSNNHHQLVGDQHQTNGGIFNKKDNPFNEDFFNMLNSSPAEPAGQPQQQQFDTFWCM